MSNLFETTTIKSLQFDNRFVRSAMTLGLADQDGSCTPRLLDRMKEFALGGVGLIITGYLGSLLMAGGFLAIGCFFSAISKNQVISFVLSVVACAILVFAGMPTTLNYFSTFLPGGMVSAIESMSFQKHFESMQKGVLKFGDLSYFVLLIVGWIAASSIILDERKAK